MFPNEVIDRTCQYNKFDFCLDLWKTRPIKFNLHLVSFVYSV